jgi:hypothetical protein
MEVSVEIKSGREWVARGMKSTMGQTGRQSGLSDKTFLSMLKPGHSPIEEYEIWIDAIVPERVHTHVVRHEEIGKYVATSRPDISYCKPIEDGMRRLSLKINAKRLIEIMRIRLCGKAWHETVDLFNMIALKLILLDRVFKSVLVPTCVWYGFCPENKCCGYIKTEQYVKERNCLIGDSNVSS